MIIGKRVRLRAIEHNDLAAFVKWLNDPEVRQGLMLFLPLSQAEEEEWFTNMLKSPAVEHPLVIEVKTADQWQAIGNCGFHQLDGRVRSAEVGIFIGDKSKWNQGYGTEVMRLMLAHGFQTLNLNRIFLRVYDNNRRAIRAYEKAGFVHEGRMRQAQYQDGQYLDLLLMSILRNEWQSE